MRLRQFTNYKLWLDSVEVKMFGLSLGGRKKCHCWYTINYNVYFLNLTLSAVGKTAILTPKSNDTELKKLTFPNSF